MELRLSDSHAPIHSRLLSGADVYRQKWTELQKSEVSLGRWDGIVMSSYQAPPAQIVVFPLRQLLLCLLAVDCRVLGMNDIANDDIGGKTLATSPAKSTTVIVDDVNSGCWQYSDGVGIRSRK